MPHTGDATTIISSWYKCILCFALDVFSEEYASLFFKKKNGDFSASCAELTELRSQSLSILGLASRTELETWGMQSFSAFWMQFQVLAKIRHGITFLKGAPKRIKSIL